MGWTSSCYHRVDWLWALWFVCKRRHCETSLCMIQWAEQFANRKPRVMKRCPVHSKIIAFYRYHNPSSCHTAKSPGKGLENYEPRCITMQILLSATEESAFRLFVNWNLFMQVSASKADSQHFKTYETLKQRRLCNWKEFRYIKRGEKDFRCLKLLLVLMFSAPSTLNSLS